MKCYLHIGTEKTGTTTIQSFLYENRERLADQGFYYPLSLRYPDNRYISMVAYNPNRRDDITKKLNIRTDQQLVDFQDSIIKEFNEEMKNVSSDMSTVISGEHIQSRLTSLEEINRLKDILNKAGFEEVKVIVYLRNPAEIANSLLSTAVKSDEPYESVPEPSHSYLETLCNHKRTVENYTSVFGKENLIVRLFRKDRFYKGSLIHDISKCIGVDSENEELVYPQYENEGLSLLGIKVLAKLNHKIPRFDAMGENPYRADLVRWISKYFSTPKFYMEKELYQAYDTYFEESNQWIKENYFPEEPELFPYQHPQVSSTQISEAELQQITDFVADLWLSRSEVLEDKWYNFTYKDKKVKFNILRSYFWDLIRGVGK